MTPEQERELRTVIDNLMLAQEALRDAQDRERVARETLNTAIVALRAPKTP